MTTALAPRKPRGTYLGGQQIAAVLGLHPYMSIGHVYERSVYGDDDVDPDAPPIRRGRIVEPGLVEEARRIDGVPLDRWHRDVFLVDRDVPFFAGTLDAASTNGDGTVDTIYEVTTCSTRTLHLWGEGDEAAARYKWVQAQWYMGIAGARRARIFALVVDTDELREYTIPRATYAIQEMRDVGEAFWLDHVVPKVPPKPDAFGLLVDPERASDVMDRIYRAAEGGREVPPTPELVDAALAYCAARDAKKTAEQAMAAASAQLKAGLEDATLLKWPGGRVSWTKNRDGLETDLEGVVGELAARAKIDAHELGKLRERFLVEKRGPRVMRVLLNKAAASSPTGEV